MKLSRVRWTTILTAQTGSSRLEHIYQIKKSYTFNLSFNTLMLQVTKFDFSVSFVF